MKADPLYVIISVGKFACVFMITLMIFAVLTALGLEIGQAKAYLIKHLLL